MQIITTTVTRKGQITIPQDFRKYLDIKPNSKITMVKGDNHIRIEPGGPSIFDLAGKFKIPKSMPDILKSREAMEKKYSRS
ncbi:MAG: hypothetical protein UT00_C0034G0005 [Parcubacteria group bacterium GW2011_GWA1_38_7]|nr:MAG: hypothetical protein UT00_C0034G0005 [Parcubacteria group bacterium GW2011_GWA1_38_7]